MKYEMKKRILSLVLCISMVLPMAAVPMPVYSVENEESIAPLSNPFTPETIIALPDGTTTKSQSYRIPSMVTLADGTIVAAADIRWNTTYDGGGLDTLVARSTDGGANWSYTVANYLGDNGNAYNAQSTTFIDPNLLVAADGQTVYMLVDLYAYGIALNGNGSQIMPVADTGFDANGNLKLSDNSHYSYNYYLKNGKIYDSSNNVVEGYEIDAYFNITYTQNGESKKSNLFFADSPFKVARTQYLYLTKSTDGGATWSEPDLLDVRAKAKVATTEKALLVSPGNSITTSSGIMVFPVYSYNGSAKSQQMAFIYSTDGGETWLRSDNFTGGATFSSEAAVVELENRNLRFFYRSDNKVLSYADFNLASGNWSAEVQTEVPANSDTQLSAITYSKTMDGKQVILISCPTGPNGEGSDDNNGSARINGKIHVFVMEEDGTMTLKNTVNMFETLATEKLPNANGDFFTEEQGFFSYSSMTERADGSIAILYENSQSGWGADDDKHFTINAKAYSSSAFGITFDSKEIVSREKDGITVTGYIPGAVELQIAGVSDDKLNAVNNGLIDKSGFSEILSISGKDITLLDGNSGKPWHPGADRPVTVTVSNVWTPAGKEMPSVDVYHILDDAQAVAMAQAGGYLLTCTDPAVLALYPQEAALLDGSAVPYVRLPGIEGGAVVNQDGSITFETDSFSDYYVVLGFTDTNSLSFGTDTYYVEPGSTLTFSSSVAWTPVGTIPAGITASGNTITISNDTAIPSEAKFSVRRNSRTYTITVIVASREQIISATLNDLKYPVILSVVRGVTRIPSEPGETEGQYSSFNPDYSLGAGWFPSFSATANGVISPQISDVLIKSIDGTNTIGYADASGNTILPYLSGIDWNKILRVAVQEKWQTIDGTAISPDEIGNYRVVPYVVKLISNQWKGVGWHIDCAIVRKESATLSYNVNLDNYTVTEKIVLPNAVSDTPVFNASVGNITGLTGGSTVLATYNGDQMTLTFKGWNTSPDGNGTSYAPGSNISISEDTVLYAIWEGRLVSGELYIYKTVTAEDGAAEPDGATYQFNVQFGTAGIYSYTVYNADGSTASSGSFNMQGIIVLANGQYAAFTGIPANTTYTVTETAGSYTTTSEGGSGVVRSGGRAVARFVNHYAYTEPADTSLTISKAGHFVVDENQSFLFSVKGQGVDLIVTVHGNGSTKINGLKVGGEYTVTELTDWSWRYEFSAWEVSGDITTSDNKQENGATITLGATGNTITFTNTRDENKWLDGDTYEDNHFNHN